MATFEDNVPPPFISPNLCYVSGPLLDKFLKPGKCVGRYTEITVELNRDETAHGGAREGK